MSKLNKNKSANKQKTREGKPKKSKFRIQLWSAIVIIGLVIGLGSLLLWEEQEANTNIAEVVVYKSPSCNCCNKWISHLRDAGFKVTGNDRQNMNSIKSDLGVERKLQSCHTAVVDGYVIEGHVPANDIKRMLQERPDVTGLTVPGMPVGSPGMESKHKEPYDVLTFDKYGQTSVYASYGK